jgi:hypothetical protein
MFAALRKAFGDHYLYAGLGTTITFDQRQVAADNMPLPKLGQRAMDDEDARSYRALLAGSDDRAGYVLAVSQR